jgi:hypothetical protein
VSGGNAPLPEQRRRTTPAVSAKARGLFLEALAAGWSVTHAAARAGVHRRRVYDLRGRDQSFAADWDDAVAEGTERLEDEARRRAVDGWDEPIYQRGELVGQVRKYDSSLLALLLRARDPHRFRESVQVDAGGAVTFVLDSLLQRARDEEAARPAQLADVEIAGELEPPKEEP